MIQIQIPHNDDMIESVNIRLVESLNVRQFAELIVRMGAMLGIDHDQIKAAINDH